MDRCLIYFGQDYTIDESSEAGNRFDQNVTGFRDEEEMGFSAEPAVRAGRVQIVAGIQATRSLGRSVGRLGDPALRAIVIGYDRLEARED